MSILTIRELECLAILKQRWATQYVAELARLLRELDRPYLLQPRATARRRMAAGRRRRRGR